MKKIHAMLALAACLAGSACAATPGEPDDSPSVSGTIQQIQQELTPPRFLVEQATDRSAGEPVAWVEVVERTKVYERREGRLVRVSAEVLRMGDRVSVWFDGPVRESWPVQAIAGTIILER